MYGMNNKSHGILGSENGMNSFENLNFKGIDINFVHTPTLISQFTDEIVFEIAAGSKHSMFATLSDKVFACGSGLQGQLGFGCFSQ